MRTRLKLFFVLLAIASAMAGCTRENTALKQDAREISAVMCKSIEAMAVLEAVDPADSAKIGDARAGYKAIQDELAGLYRKFQAKYGDKSNDKEFNKEFRKHLNTFMLECRHLSAKDREVFEREVQD